MTEIHAAMPIIGGISELQLLKIHCGFLLQCSPTPRALPIHSDASRCRDSVHLYEEFSGACCYQDIIQRGYKMNAGQTLTYSKWLPNFRTIGILLPETQGPQSCPLWVGKPSSRRSKFCTQGDPNFVRKAIQFRTQVCVGFCTQPTYGDCTQILYGRIAWAIRKFSKVTTSHFRALPSQCLTN